VSYAVPFPFGHVPRLYAAMFSAVAGPWVVASSTAAASANRAAVNSAKAVVQGTEPGAVRQVAGLLKPGLCVELDVRVR
jgi:hypothetical protein